MGHSLGPRTLEPRVPTESDLGTRHLERACRLIAPISGVCWQNLVVSDFKLIETELDPRSSAYLLRSMIKGLEKPTYEFHVVNCVEVSAWLCGSR